MDFVMMTLMSLGLVMDTFAVAVGAGLSVKKVTLRYALTISIWFAASQFIMPIIGYVIGASVYDLVYPISPWILFIVLSALGIKLIGESLSEEEDEGFDVGLSPASMFTLSIAVGLDTLVVGIGYAAQGVPILDGSLNLGVMTFIFTMLGVYLGSVMGEKSGKYTGIAGGILLICLGIFEIVRHYAIPVG